jgi:hypothetical protein
MHNSDGLRAYGIERKAVIVLVILPFLLVSLNCVEASPEKTLTNPSHVTLGDSVLIAGVFRYFDVTLPSAQSNVCIIAFNGDIEPESHMRSEKNYYKWEYENGMWKDSSGYETCFLDPSRCLVNNTTYMFYLKISQKANPGSWTLKILVDDTETCSKSLQVIIGDFCLFFSTIFSVFEPPMKQKHLLLKDELFCCDKQKKQGIFDADVQRLTDVVLRKQPMHSSSGEALHETRDMYSVRNDSVYTQESVRTTISLYPRTRFKESGYDKTLGLSHQKSRVGGNTFWSQGLKGLNRLFLFLIMFLLLTPVIIPNDVVQSQGRDICGITIVNDQSYPLIGGNWTVFFSTIGCADLIITAVNATSWNTQDPNADLEFLCCTNGNGAVMYSWINDSVYIPNFTSNLTCSEVSKVLTPGVHVLRFQFGDAIAYAYNLASEHWLQTSSSDFNNGTKTNINVSSGSFRLQQRYILRNFTLINNEGFEGSWPPTGWSENPAGSVWNKEGDQVYAGSYSADFDGVTGPGGASGNLVSPAMNCAGSNVTAVYIQFWGYSDAADNGEYYLDYYDGSTWDEITRLDNFGDDVWAHYSQKITDPQYFKTNFQIRWRVVGLNNNEHVYVDVVNVTVERNESGYFSTGNLLSPAHDTIRTIPNYNNIFVGNTTLTGTTITTWIRSADTQVNLSTASWYSTISQVPNKRWVQWRINLTGNTYLTPTVIDVNLTWTYDDEYPVSSVDSLSTYWQKTTPFQIFVTASDNGTGIKEVALFYNYSANNLSGWTGWNRYGGNDTSNPYTWSFLPPQGDGYYRFYSKAVDEELNTEADPDAPGYDTFCGVDTVKPSSRLDNISPYWYVEPERHVIINCSTANDSLSGLQNILLYYRYRGENASAWGTWRLYGSDTTAPWSWVFPFPKAKGFYQFYSIAVDAAGNTEDPPITPDNDTECAYNSTKPYSEVDTISPYWQSSSLTITAQATDNNGSGLMNVTLYYYFSVDNNTWSSSNKYGVVTDPWTAISWVFTFLNGTGYYRFYSLAFDNDSEEEYFTGNDTIGGYDVIKPTSQVDLISPYWYNATTTPLLITVTNSSDAHSGVKNITLYYRYRTNNESSWNTAMFYGVDENFPWSWNFSFPGGNGQYQFYSRANDVVGNIEDPPSSPDYDTQCGYDTLKPSSQVNTISPYEVPVLPFQLTASASDDTDNVTLWYRYSTQNSSWWDSYMYVKQITITNRNASILVKNYSINFTFDHSSLVSAGKSLANGNDVRIAYYNGTSYVEMDRINTTAFNTVTTTLWFKLQNNIPASGSDGNYYLFYDNPSALSPPQNKSNVYLWFDDFNRANKADITVEPAYRKTNGGTWAIENQKLRNTGATGDPNKLIVAALGNLTQDVDMQIKINVTTWIADADTARMGLTCCMDTLNGEGYCALFHQTHSRFDFLNDLRSWGTSATVSWSNNQWYNMKFRVVNPSARTGLAKVWPVGSTEPTTWNNTGNFGTGTARARGQVGISGSRQADVTYFDDFIIRYVLPNEPYCTLSTETLNGWVRWNSTNNPDTSSPWNWNFDFPDGYGYYWFYSIAVDFNGNVEDIPNSADAWCHFVQASPPVINSYDLRNITGSKLDNATGLLDVNYEYYFSVNITAKFGWMYIDYIDITAWYDQGSDSILYNQTVGGNLNMYLRYENVTGNGSFQLLWPKNEVELITSNCSETIVNSTTRIINISFKPLNQTHWASSNNTWDTMKNTTNDPFSWNFNITVVDMSGLKAWKTDEYGIYKFALLLPDKNWVDVEAPPGYNATTNIVNITYCSNYEYNLSIYFEENLTNVTSNSTIPIANNVFLCANADMNDDITYDMMFNGIGEINAIDIINSSGFFQRNNTSQCVHVQFNVYIPFGTIRGQYTAHVATKIKFSDS